MFEPDLSWQVHETDLKDIFAISLNVSETR